MYLKGQFNLLYLVVLSLGMQTSILSMDQSIIQHRNPKSTDNDVCIVFADLINEKINTLSLSNPTNLLDAVIKLHWLCTNIFNIELHSNEYQNLILKNEGIELFGSFTIPLDSIFDYYRQQAAKKVFKKNKKIERLIQITAQLFAQKITSTNKEFCLALLEKWLPKTIIDKIKKAVIESFGWANSDFLKKQTVNVRNKVTFNNVLKNTSIRLKPAIIASTDKGIIKLWNKSTHTCIQTLSLPYETIVAIKKIDNAHIAALSTFVSGSDEYFDEHTTVTVWNWKTGKKLYSLDVSSDSSTKLETDHQSLVISNNKNTMIINKPTFDAIVTFLAEKNSNNPSSKSSSTISQWILNLYNSVIAQWRDL